MDLLTFGLGVGVGGVVATLTLALLFARATHQPETEPQQRQAQALVCTSCDRPFADRTEAREHCRDVHNAPDAQSADHLLAEAAVEGSA